MKKEERNAQQVLEDELMSTGIFTYELAANPTEALSEIISWHCDVALDPNVSERAKLLQTRGYFRGKSETLDKIVGFLDTV